MKYKILLAINNQEAENYLMNNLNEKSQDYEVVGRVTNKDSVLDFIESNTVNVLVMIEEFIGGSKECDFLINLKISYPNLRIVFIAGNKQPGDSQLAKLIAYQIFDILPGNKISVDEIVKKIIYPSTWKDASIYLPNTNQEIFTEDELSQNTNKIVLKEDINTVTTEVLSDDKKNDVVNLSLKDRFLKKKSENILKDDIPKEEISKNSTLASSQEENKNIVKEVEVLKSQLKDTEKKLQKTETEKIKIEKENEKIAYRNKELVSEYDRVRKELIDMDKSRNVNSKQKVITFYGALPGVGCTTVALNTAVYLALAKHKVIYIEFNDLLPTLSDWFDLRDIPYGLEKAFFAIETRNYQDINKCITTKNNILDLKSELNDSHMKYPDSLNYMFFSQQYMKTGEINKINPNTLKDLLLFLLYKEGYDYVILDIYAHSDFHIIETSSIFSSLNVFVMTQDVMTIGASVKMFAALKNNGIEFEFLKDQSVKGLNNSNFKNIYLLNKYNNDIKFKKNGVKEWLETNKVICVPENSADIVNGFFQGLPAILTSKNRDFLISIKNLTEMFK